MIISRNGEFSYTIKAGNLAKGLLPFKKKDKNEDYLLSCAGLVNQDGLLSTMDTFTELPFDLTDVDYPYPQIFNLTSVLIVCLRDKIFEYKDNQFILVFETAQSGAEWAVVESFDFLLLSNGRIVIKRDPLSKEYVLVENVPTFMSICNYNGQLIIGSPNGGYK